MRRAGLEPAAPRLRGECSCRLSLQRTLKSGTGRTRTVNRKGVGGIDETRTRTFLIDNQAHSLCASIPNLNEEASGCTKREPRAFLRARLTPRVSGLAGGSRTRNDRVHGAALCTFELRPT